MAGSVSSDYTVDEINQYTGLRQYTISPLSSRNAFGGFPCYTMAFFLGVREVKLTGEYTARVSKWTTTASRILLPVRTVPVSSPSNFVYSGIGSWSECAPGVDSLICVLGTHGSQR